MKTYHKPVQTYETGELAIAEFFFEIMIMYSLGLMLSPTEKLIFLSLYYWRDVVARECIFDSSMICRTDESVQYVLSLTQILRIVKKKPCTLEALQAILVHPSNVVHERMSRLISIVKNCLEADPANTNPLLYDVF